MCIEKQRHYSADKGPYSQSCGFSSSHVWMWELDCKDSWVPNNWCLWTVVLKKTPENPLDNKEISSVQFSSSFMSDSLQPHEPQHTRPPCPSPTPRVHPNPWPLCRWCHPTISSSVIPFSSCPQSLSIRVFSNESTLRMRWPKYWSFSFSIIPSKEIPGLISFRMD